MKESQAFQRGAVALVTKKGGEVGFTSPGGKRAGLWEYITARRRVQNRKSIGVATVSLLGWEEVG